MGRFYGMEHSTFKEIVEVASNSGITFSIPPIQMLQITGQEYI